MSAEVEVSWLVEGKGCGEGGMEGRGGGAMGAAQPLVECGLVAKPPKSYTNIRLLLCRQSGPPRRPG